MDEALRLGPRNFHSYREGIMRFSSGFASVLAAFLIISSGTSALALPTAQALYTETYAEGVWRYECTLYNGAETTTGFDIFDFFLRFDSATTLSDVSSPTGWESTGWASMDSETFYVEWFSPISNTDLQPGDGLGGLSVTSLFQLGSLSFEAMFTNPEGDPLKWTGKTEPLTCVPEPGSALLMVLGLVGLALLSRFVPTCPARR
jgi:hypothetical protein